MKKKLNNQDGVMLEQSHHRKNEKLNKIIQCTEKYKIVFLKI